MRKSQLDVPERTVEANPDKHFKIIGAHPAPIVNEMVTVALARGDTVVAAAHDTGQLERHYKSGHSVLFSTTDPRSARLNLFKEIRQALDVDEIARSLVPDFSGTNGAVSSQESRTRDLARILVTDTMKRLWEQGNDYKQQTEGSVAPFHTTGMLIRFLSGKSHKNLRTLLEGTESDTFLNTPDGEKALARASSETSWLQVLDKGKGPAISIRDWVSQHGGREGGAIFIHNPIRPSGAFPRMIPTLMKLAMHGVLERERGGESRPVWLANDRFDETSPIQGMPDMLMRLPKSGGRVVLGISSIEKLRDLYGNADATAIAEHSRNTLIAGDHKRLDKSTAEYAAGLVALPERRSIFPAPIKNRLDQWSAYTTQHFGYPPPMADRIATLPVGRGYLKTASGPWQKVMVSTDSIAAAMDEKSIAQDRDAVSATPGKPRGIHPPRAEPVERTEGKGSSASVKKNPPNPLIQAAVREAIRNYRFQSGHARRPNASKASSQGNQSLAEGSER